jgi:hypothetical protein
MGERSDRRPDVWCSRCRRPHRELVYLTDGRHYCWDCAVYLHRSRGLENSGRRSDDIRPWSLVADGPGGGDHGRPGTLRRRAGRWCQPSGSARTASGSHGRDPRVMILKMRCRDAHGQLIVRRGRRRMERVGATCRRCLCAESELIYLSDQRCCCWPCAEHVHEQLVATITPSLSIAGSNARAGQGDPPPPPGAVHGKAGSRSAMFLARFESCHQGWLSMTVTAGRGAGHAYEISDLPRGEAADQR